jgi:catechol 2,3-dioxygenase-like lactoylglutathione lyase family enzyme
MIRALYETHLRVTDIGRSRQFYENTMGLVVGWVSEDQRGVLYWVGPPGKTMLGIRQFPAAEVLRQHISFEIALEEMKDAALFLKDKGLTAYNIIDKSPSPVVHGWMPAVSLYFDDPDGHMLEFIAMLPDRPRPEVGAILWGEWNRTREASS